MSPPPRKNNLEVEVITASGKARMSINELVRHVLSIVDKKLDSIGLSSAAGDEQGLYKKGLYYIIGSEVTAVLSKIKIPEPDNDKYTREETNNLVSNFASKETLSEYVKLTVFDNVINGLEERIGKSEGADETLRSTIKSLEKDIKTIAANITKDIARKSEVALKSELNEEIKNITKKIPKNFIVKSELDTQILKTKRQILDEINDKLSILGGGGSTNLTIKRSGSGGGGTWGSITGTLSNQTDLQTALDAKLNVDGSTPLTANWNAGAFIIGAGGYEIPDTLNDSLLQIVNMSAVGEFIYTTDVSGAPKTSGITIDHSTEFVITTPSGVPFHVATGGVQRFEVSGSAAQMTLGTSSTAVTFASGSTGSAKTLTTPNVTGTLATIANLAQTFLGQATFANGLRINSGGLGNLTLAYSSSASSVTWTFPVNTATVAGLEVANVFTQNQTISKTTPKLIFTDAGGDDYEISVTSGAFDIRNTTDGRDDISISNTGQITLGGTLLPRAGTASANTAPIKLTSGTNMTTAETGAIEYNGTNLFFTRTGTTREGVLVGNRGAAAPATNAIGVIVDYYGTSATRVLTTPNTWFSVVGDDGNTYKIPAYS